MFHRSSLKLASLYLAIMMAISLFFSMSVYQLSVQEFDRGLRDPGSRQEHHGGPDFSPQVRDQLRQEGEQNFQNAKDRVLQRLLVVNATILILGGILSYYLAHSTLKPIEAAHEAQSRFTADASHELRTPITSMRTENEVALMNPKLTLVQAKQQIKSNIEELEKITKLSEDLLRLASLEENNLGKENIKINRLIEKAVKQVQPLANKKKVIIKEEVLTDIAVYGNEDSLIEALVIIIDNAIKYSPDNSEITIKTETKQTLCVIKVKDRGAGIAASEIPHIFDRFYRADSSRSKTEVSGYGLGLSIAKNIVQHHGGSLSVISKKGEGSTFSFILPAQSSDS